MTTGLTLMEGAGEDVTQLSTAPNWGLILVNPNVGVSTPAVFNALNLNKIHQCRMWQKIVLILHGLVISETIWKGPP